MPWILKLNQSIYRAAYRPIPVYFGGFQGRVRSPGAALAFETAEAASEYASRMTDEVWEPVDLADEMLEHALAREARR